MRDLISAKPRSRPTVPGDLWTVAVRTRNRLTHHQEVEFPMVLNRASCDWTFPTFVSMLNELWESAPAVGHDLVTHALLLSFDLSEAEGRARPRASPERVS